FYHLLVLNVVHCATATNGGSFQQKKNKKSCATGDNPARRPTRRRRTTALQPPPTPPSSSTPPPFPGPTAIFRRPLRRRPRRLRLRRLSRHHRQADLPPPLLGPTTTGEVPTPTPNLAGDELVLPELEKEVARLQKNSGGGGFSNAREPLLFLDPAPPSGADRLSEGMQRNHQGYFGNGPAERTFAQEIAQLQVPIFFGLRVLLDTKGHCVGPLLLHLLQIRPTIRTLTVFLARAEIYNRKLWLHYSKGMFGSCSDPFAAFLSHAPVRAATQ
ncbi:hypothetical protein EJB05_12599, partial [Eragrostis curvula]